MSRTFIDTWKVKAVSHLNTKFDLEDEEGESTLVEISESEKYLGDILTADGKNRKNILPRAGKGVGIRKQIMSMLEDVCFGPFFFEVTLMYRTNLKRLQYGEDKCHKLHVGRKNETCPELSLTHGK